MHPPPPYAGRSQSGAVDRWLTNYFSGATLLFAASYVIAYVYNLSTAFEATSILFASGLMLKALVVTPPRNVIQGRATVVISLMFAVATFNMAVSQDVVETSLRWALWFAIVISLNRIIGAAEGSWIPALIKRLPWLFTILCATLLVSAHFVNSEEATRFARHLSGLYGNLIFASGLFALKFWQRITWSTLGLLAIYFSGAGGALFTVPIMFAPYILYSASSTPVKGVAVAMILTLGGAFFLGSQLFGRFLDIKLEMSYNDNSTSGLDRLERSRDMRWQLVQFGLQKVMDRPVGTGLGHTYADELSRLYYVSHVHNGTISTLVELGFPGFAVVASILIWIMWSILRSNTIENQLKGFYFTYTFTIFGRSLSENYTPFDLGNFFNFVFLVFTISLFLHQRSKQHALQSQAGPRQPVQPMAMPRMGMRPPMPRPLPMR